MPDHVILRGDCLEVLPTLTNASVDLLIADLPYGTTYADWDRGVLEEPPLCLKRSGGSSFLTKRALDTSPVGGYCPLARSSRCEFLGLGSFKVAT